VASGALKASSLAHLLEHCPNRRAGNMTHLMPNGQNFIDQLKKQLAALEQGKTS
jgi:hypothetical protein